jgi:hypothetical protein
LPMMPSYRLKKTGFPAGNPVLTHFT